MMKSARMPVHELNPYLTCMLCGGYLIDATTIIECLHSFCRTCIVHYLHTSNYCPVCECLVHKKYPHQNLRPDKTLQDVVYKVVPGLFMEEMRRRRKYYSDQTDELQNRPGRIIFSPDEKISLCMRLCTMKLDERSSEDYEFQDKRYLLCPARMSVYHLKKFLRLKYSLSDRLEVEMFHMDEVLKDEYSLVDVSYITGWKREKVMVLNYAFYENTNKKFKRSISTGAVSPGNDDSGIEDETSNQDENNPDQTHVTSQSFQASMANDNQQLSQGDEKPSDSSQAADSVQLAESTADVVENTASVVVNTAEVVENTSNMVENTSDVVENTSDDVENNDAVESKTNAVENTADLVENTTDMVENTTDMVENTVDIVVCNAEKDVTIDVNPDKEQVEEKIEADEDVGKPKNETENEEKNYVQEKIQKKEDVVVSLEINERDSDSQRESVVPELDNPSETKEKEESNFVRECPSPENNSITIEDEEGALQIVIEDSKSEKSSDDSGIQIYESSPNENDSVCSNDSRPSSATIKIPQPDMFRLLPPISYRNSTHRSKSPKTSTPFHSLNSSRYPRYPDSIGFSDSSFLSYSPFNNSIAHTSSCPQTDFDTDEIWTDGVMDLSKPKPKTTETGCYQEIKSSVVQNVEEEEVVEKYTYVVDGLEESEESMEVDSGYANENNTPERYSLLSPDQNEVTSTRVEHVPFRSPVMIENPPLCMPKLSVVSSSIWKREKVSDVSKKSSSGKHHKRRKSSDSSKHKGVFSNGHSKCTDICNGHTVVPRPESSSYKKHQGEKLILNQPRCEKLIISQSRCEKAPKNKPRCEKLVVKLSKERNSEHYTATMS
ncbi:uncharacterized protein LOC133194108 [Saccostrea echinata]|uniref:uncharacterized protein LOC133194108 n=1 Tax=Saccostrea echinata TaxID=191078 RepID=UPI002A830993|nr:uncharacterized protein LOC133194108 [Saccostrea echinata]